MSEQTVIVHHSSNLPVGELFAFLADHNNLSKVFLLPVTRIKDGLTEPNGIGSVRRLGPAGVGVEETVSGLVTNELIEYRITRNGGPIKDHNGRLDFSATADGSELQWTINFRSPVPLLGPAIKAILTTAITMGLKRI